MKAAVYAVKYEGNWEARVSLDLAVDQWWWQGARADWEGRYRGGSQSRSSQKSPGNRIGKDSSDIRDRQSGRAAGKLVLLARSLPLGWAVKLAAACEFGDVMTAWKEEKWRTYAADLLKAEIKSEQAVGGMRGEDWPFEVIEIIELSEVQAVKGASGPESAGMSRISPSVFAGWGVKGQKDRYELLLSAAERLGEALEGRSLLQNEVEALVAEQLPELAEIWPAAAQLAYLQERLQIEAGVGAPGAVQRHRIDAVRFLPAAALRLPLRLSRRGAAARRAGAVRCLRCGSVPTGRTACAACGLSGCAYCEACLALGRSRACALLLRSAPLPAVRCTAGVSPTVTARRWGLSAAQAAAAAAALGFLAERTGSSAAATGPERFLLWAVTGAGKTEITFPLLEAALRAGGRALIATPRRDVVLELAPRLARAFPGGGPAVLYGGSEDRWSRGSLTLATTHQLLRFHGAFDLVIIDELDAFPYHNDPMLAYAAEQVCKPAGAFIYLSATPPVELQRQADAGKLPHARVPVRFHGYPLPVPRHLHMPPLRRCLKQGRLPRGLLQALQRSFDRKAQIFLFVARIALIEDLLKLLRRIYPGIAIEGTSSKDPSRAEKVLKFRNCSISLLVTTTILERGVTVPRSDVFILDAGSELFDEAALVQMAGRAGRSKDDPAGFVYFASPEWTRAQRRAIAQIRSMNRLARKQGYLRGR
ncbi:helicase-related protein [Paenibacillus sp. MMS20-IR301]|uniref:DEAD/DEAH box helicase n=1 Tax=Paenibacillus sp. MMS20-IR301 TaxID=2895946 RepID=UPI0028E4E406|nr:helicase-related protein [Paenibacillus sp. MMS20-IR301]WNS42657.1 helicase-related protein [Paenibacillus sp. MMS20-IR301]